MRQTNSSKYSPEQFGLFSDSNAPREAFPSPNLEETLEEKRQARKISERKCSEGDSENPWRKPTQDEIISLGKYTKPMPADFRRHFEYLRRKKH